MTDLVAFLVGASIIALSVFLGYAAGSTRERERHRRAVVRLNRQARDTQRLVDDLERQMRRVL